MGVGYEVGRGRAWAMKVVGGPSEWRGSSWAGRGTLSSVRIRRPRIKWWTGLAVVLAGAIGCADLTGGKEPPGSRGLISAMAQNCATFSRARMDFLSESDFGSDGRGFVDGGVVYLDGSGIVAADVLGGYRFRWDGETATIADYGDDAARTRDDVTRVAELLGPLWNACRSGFSDSVWVYGGPPAAVAQSHSGSVREWAELKMSVAPLPRHRIWVGVLAPESPVEEVRHSGRIRVVWLDGERVVRDLRFLLVRWNASFPDSSLAAVNSGNPKGFPRHLGPRGDSL